MNLNSIFSLLGLGGEFARIYTILIEKGKLRMIDIGKIANLPRTSCYEYIPKLIDMGLVSEIIDGKSKYYSAQSPSNLLSLLYKLKNDLNYELQNFENNFQSLMSQYSSNQGQKSVHEIENIEEFQETFESIRNDNDLLIILPSQYSDKLNKQMLTSINTLIRKHPYLIIEGMEILKFITNDKILTLSTKTGTSIVYSDRNIINSERTIFEKLQNARTQ